MTPHEWKPPAGLPQIPGVSNIYIIQAPVEVTKTNKKMG